MAEDTAASTSQHAVQQYQSAGEQPTEQAFNPLFAAAMDNSGVLMEPTTSCSTPTYQRTQEKSIEMRPHGKPWDWLRAPTTGNTMDATLRKKMASAEASEVPSDEVPSADDAWMRPAVSCAHGGLLLFSIVKIVIGALWVKPYTGVIMSFFGAVGVMLAAMYAAYFYFAHRPMQGEGMLKNFFRTSTQLNVVTAIVALCAPPCAFVDGMFMHGLIRDTAVSSLPTIVFASAHLLAQLVMLVVILVEGLEGLSLLTGAENAQKRPNTPEDMV